MPALSRSRTSSHPSFSTQGPDGTDLPPFLTRHSRWAPRRRSGSSGPWKIIPGRRGTVPRGEPHSISSARAFSPSRSRRYRGGLPPAAGEWSTRRGAAAGARRPRGPRAPPRAPVTEQFQGGAVDRGEAPAKQRRPRQRNVAAGGVGSNWPGPGAPRAGRGPATGRAGRHGGARPHPRARHAEDHGEHRRKRREQEQRPGDQAQRGDPRLQRPLLPVRMPPGGPARDHPPRAAPRQASRRSSASHSALPHPRPRRHPGGQGRLRRPPATSPEADGTTAGMAKYADNEAPVAPGAWLWIRHPTS